jgi:hypothetical protein
MCNLHRKIVANEVLGSGDPTKAGQDVGLEFNPNRSEVATAFMRFAFSNWFDG